MTPSNCSFHCPWIHFASCSGCHVRMSLWRTNQSNDTLPAFSMPAVQSCPRVKCVPEHVSFYLSRLSLKRRSPICCYQKNFYWPDDSKLNGNGRGMMKLARPHVRGMLRLQYEVPWWPPLVFAKGAGMAHSLTFASQTTCENFETCTG